MTLSCRQCYSFNSLGSLTLSEKVPGPDHTSTLSTPGPRQSDRGGADVCTSERRPGIEGVTIGHDPSSEGLVYRDQGKLKLWPMSVTLQVSKGGSRGK